MSINTWTDKEDVVYTYNGILLSHNKEWNNAICSNKDGLEIIILSEVSQTEKDKHHMILLIHGMSKNYTDTNEIIH